MDGRTIESDLNFTRIDQVEFKEIDYRVMGAAFDIQNDLKTAFHGGRMMGGRIIESDLNFTRIDQVEFKEIDYRVMGAAFDIQNDLGRLFSKEEE